MSKQHRVRIGRLPTSKRFGSDRHNIAVLRPQAFPEGTPGIAVPVKLKHGQWGMNIPDCLCNSTFLGMSYADRNLLVISGKRRKFILSLKYLERVWTL